VRRAIAAVAAVLTAAACSTAGPTQTATTAQSSPPTTTVTTGAPTMFPVTIVATNGEVEIPAAPHAIVSLSPTATEMLFAIGAAGQVVAVDDQSNYPAGAPVTDLTGFSPNVEAIAAYDPDLVVISFDPGDLITALDMLDVPVLLEPAAATLDDVYDQIEQLGTATGHPDEAHTLAETMRKEIEQTLAAVTAASGEPLTYYFELDSSYYSVTSSTFIGQVVGALGLDNIADAADTEGYGYPQLSSEYVIDADPDLILLADTKCCDQSAATVEARPGWASIAAVEKGNVIDLDDDVASRWGPRVVDLVEAVAAAIEQARRP
jgi:iron complex transport system substrate-binding protein